MEHSGEQYPRPHGNTYWVEPGRLLAGEYPGTASAGTSHEKLKRYLDAGVTFFVNLTHPDDSLLPYEDILQDEAAKRGIEVRHVWLPIIDMDVPQPEHMADILTTIETALAAGHTVYVHCWGGIGRTGTVVGCYLVGQGMSGDEALREIARRWQTVEKRRYFPHSPQTMTQFQFVQRWSEIDPRSDRFDRFRGCLLGLAVGDAVGTTLEFKPPGSFRPIADMVGGGPFHLKAGQWTDDTSMALCLAASLVERHHFDAADQMKRYVQWWEHGYMSSTGACFDIGNTVASALQKFKRTGDPIAGSTNPYAAGNGSIMRLAPAPMFYLNQPELAIEQAGESSKTTHGAAAAVDACRFLAGLLVGAISGAGKDELLSANYSPVPDYWQKHALQPDIAKIAAGSYTQKQPPHIKGTGYVVDSLEAALWAFYHSQDFRAGCLKAVNLGHDADTTGAVYGQLAGAFYGASAIPPGWLEKLAMRDVIEELIGRLYTLATGG